MQKRKLFTVLAAILAICLVGLSATCLAPGEAPTLELEIYDGPDYYESEGMCYYRVEATATGMPEPEIEFEEDENVNPLGSSRVEVGVEVGDSYTLNVTATNSAGSAAVSIMLEGECVDADADTDTDPDTDTDDDPGTDAEPDTDADADSDGDPEEETTAPTISLAISAGPTLQEDICFYRVKATVTGSPNPTINFSKDDSGGSWGLDIAQINLNNPSDTYTLTATANNSEGSATDSIDLSWGCDVDEVGGDDDGERTLTEIVANLCEPQLNLCGYIEKDTNVITRIVWVGDNASNRELKGYISFDISGLRSPEVHSAELELHNITHAIDPTFAANLVIKARRFGTELTLEDWAIGGTHLISVSTTGLTDIVISGSGLTDSIQEAVNNYGDYFQIKIGLSTGTDSDGTADFFNIDLNNARLIVNTIIEREI